MYKWLQDFAYRVDLSWWILLAAAVALVIAWITVSLQALRAALSNPINT
jgi:putative ABC transport system permease protein